MSIPEAVRAIAGSAVQVIGLRACGRGGLSWANTRKSVLPPDQRMTMKDPAEVPRTDSRPTDPQKWVDRHGDALFRFAMVRLGHRELAEETVQETFLAALEARDRFTAASSERTWLIAILKHKVVDRIRRSAREERATDTAADDEAMTALFEGGYWRSRPSAWPRWSPTWNCPFSLIGSRWPWDAPWDSPS